jgi:hypothetical protein
MKRPTRTKKKRSTARKLDYAPSKEAVELRKRLEAEYDLSDSVGQVLLDQLQRAFDRREEARRILDAEGCVTTGRYGQRVQHPAGRVERSASDLFIATIRALNVEYEPNKTRSR